MHRLRTFAVAALSFALAAAAVAQSGTGQPSRPPGGPAGTAPAGPGGAGVGAPPGGQRGPEGRGGPRGGQPQSFDGGMRQAGRAFRALKDSKFDAASRTNDLELIQSLQSGLLASKGQIATVPMSAAATAKFGADAASYQLAFRRQLLKTLNEAFTLEHALLDGKGDAARTAFAKLTAEQDAGHALFGEPQDDDGDAPNRGGTGGAGGAGGGGGGAGGRGGAGGGGAGGRGGAGGGGAGGAGGAGGTGSAAK